MFRHILSEPVLYSLAMYSGTFSNVALVLKIMQSDYAEKLDVEHLADKAHMSDSAFHRAFKEITSDSPMQYLKKIGLTKAKFFNSLLRRIGNKRMVVNKRNKKVRWVLTLDCMIGGLNDLFRITVRHATVEMYDSIHVFLGTPQILKGLAIIY